MKKDDTCSACGTPRVHKDYCVECYEVFNRKLILDKLQTKFKAKSSEELHDLKVKHDILYRLFLIIPIHVVFLVLLLIPFLRINNNVLLVVDWIDTLIITIFFLGLIVINGIYSSIIKSVILKKDLQSRIRLSYTRYRRKLLFLTDNEYEIQKRKYPSRNIGIDNYLNRYSLNKKRRLIFLTLFIVFILLAFIIFSISYLLLTIGLLFLYPIVIMKDNQELYGLFRVKGNSKIKNIEEHVNYVFNYLTFSNRRFLGILRRL